MPPARARALVRELTKNWGENRPAIRVAETPQEWAQALRDAGVQDAPGNARIEGMYDGSPVVWLNPAALATEKRLAEVLAHEAIGHYGVENIVGRAQWAQITSAIDRLRTSGTAAPSIQKALDEVMRRYVNRKEDGLDLNTAEGRETFAKEVIAVLAEQGVRNSFTSRVLAAVRRWLRQHMPSLKWTERDVLDLLGQADSFLRAGRTQAQQRELVQRYAFSSDAPTFYSALLEAVQQARGAPRAGTAEQWKGWLDGAVRRGEFKQAERDVSGFGGQSIDAFHPVELRIPAPMRFG